ncbi:hypothetical protein F8S20_27985 [Nostoc sp. BAE]|nr:hypothetical protein [Nostoc commune BAE]
MKSNHFNKVWGFNSLVRQAERFGSGSKSPLQNVITNYELRITNYFNSSGVCVDTSVIEIEFRGQESEVVKHHIKFSLLETLRFPI